MLSQTMMPIKQTAAFLPPVWSLKNSFLSPNPLHNRTSCSTANRRSLLARGRIRMVSKPVDVDTGNFEQEVLKAVSFYDTICVLQTRAVWGWSKLTFLPVTLLIDMLSQNTPVLVDFYAAWCGPYVSIISFFIAYYETYEVLNCWQLYNLRTDISFSVAKSQRL